MKDQAEDIEWQIKHKYNKEMSQSQLWYEYMCIVIITQECMP